MEYNYDKKGEVDTLLVEWTRELTGEVISKGAAALHKEFYKAICDLIVGK